MLRFFISRQDNSMNGKLIHDKKKSKGSSVNFFTYTLKGIEMALTSERTDYYPDSYSGKSIIRLYVNDKEVWNESVYHGSTWLSGRSMIESMEEYPRDIIAGVLDKGR